MAFHKLQTNIPVFGTVKFIDYEGERDVEKDGKSYHFYPKLKLNGTWDGIGDAKIEIPASMATTLIKDGLCELKEGTAHDFKWLYRGRVQILKAEEGTKKRTSVLAIDAPQPTNGQPPKQRAVTQADVVASQHPTTQTQGDPWSELEAVYRRAHNIAARTWRDELKDDTAKVAATATVFIAASDRGLSATPTTEPTARQQAEKIRDTLDAHAARSAPKSGHYADDPGPTDPPDDGMPF